MFSMEGGLGKVGEEIHVEAQGFRDGGGWKQKAPGLQSLLATSAT